ncbi:MAG: hypothetical protein R2827_14355 [Bdellovibrionales bacterium]
MGHVAEKGNINTLEHDQAMEIVEETRTRLRGGQRVRIKTGRRNAEIRIKLFYYAKAFSEATYADARWMTRQIAKLSKQDIQYCTNQADLPDFIKTAIVDKLMLRRQLIADAFSVEIS